MNLKKTKITVFIIIIGIFEKNVASQVFTKRGTEWDTKTSLACVYDNYTTGTSVFGCSSSSDLVSVYYYFDIPSSFDSIAFTVNGKGNNTNCPVFNLYSSQGSLKVGDITCQSSSNFNLNLDHAAIEKYANKWGQLVLEFMFNNNINYTLEKIMVQYNSSSQNYNNSSSFKILSPVNDSHMYLGNILKIKVDYANSIIKWRAKIDGDEFYNGKETLYFPPTNNIDLPLTNLNPGKHYILFRWYYKDGTYDSQRIYFYLDPPNRLSAPLVTSFKKEGDSLKLSWDIVPGAMGYEVVISHEPFFLNPVAFSTVYNAFSFTDPGWPVVLARIRANNQSEYSEWSNLRSFTRFEKKICLSCNEYYLVNTLDRRNFDVSYVYFSFFTPVTISNVVSELGLKNETYRSLLYKWILQDVIVRFVDLLLSPDEVKISVEDGKTVVEFGERITLYLISLGVPQQLLRGKLDKESLDRVASVLNTGSNSTSIFYCFYKYITILGTTLDTIKNVRDVYKKIESFEIFRELIKEVVNQLKNALPPETDPALIKALDNLQPNTIEEIGFILSPITKDVFNNQLITFLNGKEGILKSLSKIKITLFESILLQLFFDDMVDTTFSHQNLALLVSFSTYLEKDKSTFSYLIRGILSEKYFEEVEAEDSKWIQSSAGKLADIFKDSGYELYISYVRERHERIRGIIIESMTAYLKNSLPYGDKKYAVSSKITFDTPSKKFFIAGSSGPIIIENGNRRFQTYQNEILLDDIRNKVGAGHIVFKITNGEIFIVDIPY